MKVRLSLERIHWPDALTSLAVATATLAVLRPLSILQSDGDYWWHVTVGNWILDHRAVPHEQWISWLADKPTWISQEWLGEVILAVLSRFGPLGSVWFFGVVILAIWALFISLCRLTLGPARRPIEIAVLMLVASIVASPAWGPRLQLFTVLWGLAVVRITLGYLIGGERRLIWLLPVVLVLWANTHLGSVLLAFLLIGGLVVGDVFERRRMPDRFFVLVLLVSAVAPVLNPYGPAAYTFPFQTVFSPAMQSLVQEWRSPDFQASADRGLQLFIVALPAILPFGARRLDLRGLLVAAGLLLMTLQSARYDLLLALIGTALLAPALVEGVRTLLERAGYKPSSFRRPATVALGLAAAVVLVGGLLLSARQLTDGPAQDQLTTQTQPVAAAEAVQPYVAAHPDARVLDEYLWAGYLYQRLGIRSGLYGASEAFTDGLFTETVDVFLVQRDPGPFLDEHRVTMVFIAVADPLAYWLAETPNWRQLYRDGQAVVFVRA